MLAGIYFSSFQLLLKLNWHTIGFAYHILLYHPIYQVIKKRHSHLPRFVFADFSNIFSYCLQSIYGYGGTVACKTRIGISRVINDPMFFWMGMRNCDFRGVKCTGGAFNTFPEFFLFATLHFSIFNYL